MHPTITEALTLVKNSENILITTGAGMSAELGIQTYWDGDNNQYGGEGKTTYGYSTIEHASEETWTINPEAQTQYFNNLRQNITEAIQKNTRHNHYISLLKYLQTTQKSYYGVTTNIDRAFQNYGYEEKSIYEQHGTLFNSQCLKEPQKHGIFPTTLNISEPTLCPSCNNHTRPNILMFNDLTFNPTNKHKQQFLYQTYEDTLINNPTASLILEFGAGNTIPNIRNLSVRLNGHYNILVIRINLNRVQETDGDSSFNTKIHNSTLHRTQHIIFKLCKNYTKVFNNHMITLFMQLY